MHHARQRIRDAGLELVVIGNGAAHWVAGFREQTGYDGKLYIDASMASYDAVGFEHSLAKVLTVRSASAWFRATRKGFRNGVIQGDAAQLGGVLLVRPPDQLVYAYRSEFAGDHPDIDDVLAAARGG